MNFHSRVPSFRQVIFSQFLNSTPLFTLQRKYCTEPKLFKKNSRALRQTEGYLFTAGGWRALRNSPALTSIISDQCQVLHPLNVYSHSCAPTYNQKVVLFDVFSSGSLQSRDVFRKELHKKGPPWFEIVDAEY